jgi:hypothetical protein
VGRGCSRRCELISYCRAHVVRCAAVDGINTCTHDYYAWQPPFTRSHNRPVHLKSPASCWKAFCPCQPRKDLWGHCHYAGNDRTGKPYRRSSAEPVGVLRYVRLLVLLHGKPFRRGKSVARYRELNSQGKRHARGTDYSWSLHSDHWICP